MAAYRLPVTIQGREVWVQSNGMTGVPWFVVDSHDWLGNATVLSLVDAGWVRDDPRVETEGNFATELEAVQYAMRQADAPPAPYHSWFVPVQFAGQWLFINDDRLHLPRVLPGTSEACYLANGPVGRCTRRVISSGGASAAWQEMDHNSWYSEPSPQAVLATALSRLVCPGVTLEQLIPLTGARVMPTVPATRQALENRLGPEVVRIINNGQEDPRGHILAKTKIWVPDEITDIWEFLLAQALPAQTQPAYAQTAAGTATTTTNTVTTHIIAPTYTLTGHRTQTVYGRCNWSATEEQTAEMRLTAEEIADIIEEADDREEAERLLREHLEGEGEYDEDSTSDYDYDDHETQDYGDVDNYEDDVPTILDRFWREHPEHDPELEEDEEDEDEDDEDEVDGEEEAAPAVTAPLPVEDPL